MDRLDGRSQAAAVGPDFSEIWRAPGGGTGELRVLTVQVRAVRWLLFCGVGWSPDIDSEESCSGLSQTGV